MSCRHDPSQLQSLAFPHWSRASWCPFNWTALFCLESEEQQMIAVGSMNTLLLQIRGMCEIRTLHLLFHLSGSYLVFHWEEEKLLPKNGDSEKLVDSKGREANINKTWSLWLLKFPQSWGLPPETHCSCPLNDRGEGRHSEDNGLPIGVLQITHPAPVLLQWLNLLFLFTYTCFTGTSHSYFIIRKLWHPSHPLFFFKRLTTREKFNFFLTKIALE